MKIQITICKNPIDSKCALVSIIKSQKTRIRLRLNKNTNHRTHSVQSIISKLFTARESHVQEYEVFAAKEQKYKVKGISIVNK